MKQLYMAIVRHGDYHQRPETPSAHQPFGLTERGLSEAKAGAQELQEIIGQNRWHLWPTLYSSNLLRGYQTAEIYREILGHDSIEGYDDLAERSLGSAANLRLSEIEDILKADPRFQAPPSGWKSNSHYCLPLQGAESLMDAGARVADRLEGIAKDLNDAPDQTLAVVTGHGAAFRHAAYRLGIIAFDDIAKLSMYHGRPVIFARDGNGLWQHITGTWKQRDPKDRHMD